MNVLKCKPKLSHKNNWRTGVVRKSPIMMNKMGKCSEHWRVVDERVRKSVRRKFTRSVAFKMQQHKLLKSRTVSI